MNGPLPTFSIIVPTFERPDRLGACLESLSRLDYPRDRFEVIVVDDGSARPSPDLARELARELVERFRPCLSITLVTQPHRGVGAARNAGARVAQGTYLAFTADDCTPLPGWLRALAQGFAEPESDAGLGGAIHNGCPRNPCAEASHVLSEYVCRGGSRSGGNAHFFSPNNLAVPGAAFQRMGGFDVSFALSAGEDRDFCARWCEHGFVLAGCPEAVVVHRHPVSLVEFVRMHWRYGRGSGHFRRNRARRLGAGFFSEPPGFYANLLVHPIRLRGWKAVPQVVLLCLSQIANAAGMFQEWILPQKKVSD